MQNVHCSLIFKGYSFYVAHSWINLGFATSEIGLFCAVSLQAIFSLNPIQPSAYASYDLGLFAVIFAITLRSLLKIISSSLRPSVSTAILYFYLYTFTFSKPQTSSPVLSRSASDLLLHWLEEVGRLEGVDRCFIS